MSRKFLDPWVYDMFLGMGRFEPIPAQNKTWVAGLFLEPLPLMLTSEPSIHMDLLVICQLKPSQNGQIVMCQVWPFWLLICLGKWNNKSMTTGYVMKFDHGWQFNHGWLLELTNFTVGDSCGGACYEQELYNLLCPQNMWMVWVPPFKKNKNWRNFAKKRN